MRCVDCGLYINGLKCYKQETFNEMKISNTFEEIFKAVKGRAEFLRTYFPKK